MLILIQVLHYSMSQKGFFYLKDRYKTEGEGGTEETGNISQTKRIG